MALTWEQIDNYHQRAKIFGGWLVKAYEDVVHNQIHEGYGMQSGFDLRVAMCFVPDPQHLWEVVEKFDGNGKG